MSTPTIFILADRPDLYRGFLKTYKKKGRFFPLVEDLNRALIEVDDDYSCLLVDVHMVMSAPPIERDRLFALARNRPFLRTRSDSQGMQLLDDLQCLEGGEDCRPERAQNRARVRMEALYADFRDPFMTKPNEAVVLDISLGGCFLHLPNGLPEHDYLHLKILELAGQRPIHCAVRWRRQESKPGLLPGLGLKFIDISPDQLAEIEQSLPPGPDSTPTSAPA